MNVKAIGYCRVSTDEQAKGYSLQTQKEAIERCAKERGYKLVSFFQDDYSGMRLDRPGLDKLREYVARHKVSVLVVYDIDRLSRVRGHQWMIEEELSKWGVTVEYALGQYANTDEGRLQKGIRAEIAEYERAKILERMQRGKRGKAQAGHVIVAGRAPYGYREVSEPHKSWLEINDDEAQIVRLIFEWFLRGDGKGSPMTISEISKRLTELHIPTHGDNNRLVRKLRAPGVWCRSSIYRILKSETYTGSWSYGKTQMVDLTERDKAKAKAKGKGPGKEGHRKQKQAPRPRDEWIKVTVPALIDMRAFDAAQKRLAHNRKVHRGVKENAFPYLLSRLLTCAKCGYSVRGRNVGGTRQYYHCSACERSPRALCDLPHFRCDPTDAAVWAWLRGILEHPERLAEGLRAENAEAERANQALRERLALVDKLIGKIHDKLAKLLDLYLAGDYAKDLLTERNQRLEAEAADLEREREDLCEHLNEEVWTPERIAEVEATVAEIAVGLEHATSEDVRRYLELLGVRGKLAEEAGERVVYITCRLGKERVPVSSTLLK
jgi:site-specific DNA recombinase